MVTGLQAVSAGVFNAGLRIYLEHGGQSEHEMDDWLQAERGLDYDTLYAKANTRIVTTMKSPN
jgi:hypothetical protein